MSMFATCIILLVLILLIVHKKCIYIYMLNTETKGSKIFINPTSRASRTLLKAPGFINTVDTLGRGIKLLMA